MQVFFLYYFRSILLFINTLIASAYIELTLVTKGLHMKGKDDVIVYFADAYSSWQKGCVENTNKLIRRYIPKHTNFNLVSPQKIMNIQKKLNNRPSEKLNFDTPKFCFFKHFY